MNRIIAMILTMVMLLCCGAAAEGEVPEFSSALNVREIRTTEDAQAYAKEIGQLDYLGTDVSEIPETDWLVVEGGWDEGFWSVILERSEGDLEISFETDGSLTYLSNLEGGWFGRTEDDFLENGDPEDGEQEVEFRNRLDLNLEQPFLAAVNPETFRAYKEFYPTGISHEFLTHYNGTWKDGENAWNLNYSEVYNGDEYRMKIIVQVEPVIRIVYFDAFCSVYEGGNG